eukprot:TRINITY_DN7248_c0_g1_i2.p1 TRINITY_DN7248_c0_g1~~TRINITY_DN7248_c0_g1_i2.p1  ORF type:complete len:486 (-),score=80.57 TRINITY_DN7248_c0_g1_i2:136-1593(-)
MGSYPKMILSYLIRKHSPIMEKPNNLEDWIAQDPTDVEVWYNSLKDYTFLTEFVSLSHEQATALVKLHDGELSKDDTIIPDLTNKIDKIIKSFSNKAAFVRLSTLSPKDAIKSQYKKLSQLITEELKNVAMGDEPMEIRAINRAVYYACKMTSGEEAMELFKLSDRVAKHLKHRLAKTDPKKWNMNIVVREWCDIHPEFEFRMFVYQKNITALTHYYKSLYVEEIATNRIKIQDMIIDYYKKKIASKVKLEDYAIDFTVDVSTGNVKVIELNPWGEATSAAQFEWDQDEDKLVLFGKKPFEFRILERPVPGAILNVSTALRFIFFSVRQGLNEDNKTHSDNVSSFITSTFGSKGKFKPLFKSVTSAYKVTIDIDFTKIMNELSMQDRETVYWVFTDSLCLCLGSKKISSSGDGEYKNLRSTLVIICLYEMYYKNFAEEEREVWDQKIIRAYAYVFLQIQDLNKLLDECRNQCLLMKNILEIISKK